MLASPRTRSDAFRSTSRRSDRNPAAGIRQRPYEHVRNESASKPAKDAYRHDRTQPSEARHGLEWTTECSEEEAVLRQLFLMNLCSVAGYREIADLTANAEVRTFADVVARQRRAQCRALAERYGWPSHTPYDAEPAAAELRIIWLRALWALEQGEYGTFAEGLETAESILEDACLRAAQAFRGSLIAGMFEEHAMSVCGVRECLEEMVDGLCHPDVAGIHSAA